MLGTFEWRGGGFDQFVRLIVPHGLLELSCIALAGAAGLTIAGTFIDPGRSTRSDALAALVPQVGAMTLGTVLFLIVAGLTEGFITPWDLPLPLALGVRLVLSGSFWAMVVLRGRTGSPGGPGSAVPPPPVARAALTA